MGQQNYDIPTLSTLTPVNEMFIRGKALLDLVADNINFFRGRYLGHRAIGADDIKPFVLQNAGEHGSDVAAVTDDQSAHGVYDSILGVTPIHAGLRHPCRRRRNCNNAGIVPSKSNRTTYDKLKSALGVRAKIGDGARTIGTARAGSLAGGDGAAALVTRQRPQTVSTPRTRVASHSRIAARQSENESWTSTASELL